MSRLNEIKERLKNATPKPWLIVDCCPGHDGFLAIQTKNGEDVIASSEWLIASESDLLFISNSIDDIEYLINEVERLTENERRMFS